MHKFFAKNIKNNDVYFFENDVHHIINVLRLKLNDEIIITFANQKYIAKITNINPLRALILNSIEQNVDNNFILNAYCAIIKPNHLELAIIKATELNVNNFYIFDAYYSQKNIKLNLDRYQKIMMSAAKQANRTSLMQIYIIDNKSTLINNLNENDLNVFADFSLSTFKNELLSKNKNNLRQIGLIVGPEGGFSNCDFYKETIKNKYIINLSKTILRTETALIALIAIIQYLMLN